jgi:class 3 adenylate cyclase/tetratricopeptide (TPR) repeat protein
MPTREQLEQAIAMQENLRGVVDDAVVDTAVGALRDALARLAQHPAPAEQRTHVTVLFADLAGVAAPAGRQDPEQVRGVMSAYLAAVTPTILAHQGHVEEFIGDALLAVFGLPRNQERDPENAILAALAMQQALAELNARQDAAGGPRLSMRIGIHSGPVVAQALDDRAQGYAVMGDTVNIAGRIEQAAPPGTVLVSHDTYRHVRGVFEVDPLDPLPVKGQPEPLKVYRIGRPLPRAFRMTTRGVAGMEVPQIGRDAELHRLKEAMEAVMRERRARRVLVIGDAGLGKSRLLYEFEDWLDLLPEYYVLYKARAEESMRQLPFAFARDLFALRFQILENDPAQTAREKFVAGFAEFMGPDCREAARQVGALLGFEFFDEPRDERAPEDPQAQRRQAVRALVSYFEAATRTDPAVALLEDLHWADDDSLELLAQLEHEAAHLPLLLVCSARPFLFDHHPAWQTGDDEIVLQPLTPPNSRRLVREILRRVPALPNELQDTIVSHGEGNPFYVEELVKMMIDDGVIVTDNETWRVVPQPLTRLRVPPTLVEVIQARLDRLTGLEHEVLQRAAVVGRLFWDDAVARIDMPPGGDVPQALLRTRRALAGLLQKELIFARPISSFADAAEYLFKNAIVREVVYERVLIARRRLYHRQAAEWLIAKSGARVGEYAGLIAEHFERADKPGQAIEWYARAAGQARAADAPEAAIAFYRRAIALIAPDTASPSAATPTERRVELYHGLGDVLITRARYTAALEAFESMRTAAEEAGDLRAQAHAWNRIWKASSSQNDHAGALAAAEHAERLVRAFDPPDPRELAIVLWQKGNIYARLGQLAEAQALAEESLALSSTTGDRTQTAHCHNLLGLIAVVSGRLKDAGGQLEQALAIWRALDQRQFQAELLGNLGEVARLQGDDRRAASLYQQSIAIHRQLSNRGGELTALSNLGGAQVGLGEYDAALDTLSLIYDAGQLWEWSSEAQRFVAEAWLGLHDPEQALPAALNALAYGSTPDTLGNAWRVLGRIAAALGRAITLDSETVDARDCFARAETALRESGMRSERAHALWDWARYELAQGDAARGADMWREARETFAALELERFVARMDAERAA